MSIPMSALVTNPPNGLDEVTNTKLMLLGWYVWWGPVSNAWRATDLNADNRHPLDKEKYDSAQELADAVLSYPQV